MLNIRLVIIIIIIIIIQIPLLADSPKKGHRPYIERTDQLPPIELTIILKPPKADASELSRADTVSNM